MASSWTCPSAARGGPEPGSGLHPVPVPCPRWAPQRPPVMGLAKAPRLSVLAGASSECRCPRRGNRPPARSVPHLHSVITSSALWHQRPETCGPPGPPLQQWRVAGFGAVKVIICRLEKAGSSAAMQQPGVGFSRCRGGPQRAPGRRTAQPLLIPRCATLLCMRAGAALGRSTPLHRDCGPCKSLARRAATTNGAGTTTAAPSVEEQVKHMQALIQEQREVISGLCAEVQPAQASRCRPGQHPLWAAINGQRPPQRACSRDGVRHATGGHATACITPGRRLVTCRWRRCGRRTTPAAEARPCTAAPSPARREAAAPSRAPPASSATSPSRWTITGPCPTKSCW